MIGKFKLLMSLFAMLGCLLAASQLHAHEAGLYDVDHACLSCDLEHVVAHGAVPATAPTSSLQMPDTCVGSENNYISFAEYAFQQIRAPPTCS